MSEPMDENRPGIFMGGLRLVLGNKRTLLWVYLANLIVGLFGGLPFFSHIRPFLDHSMAAQKIAGSLDIGFVAELFMHANEHATGASTTATLLVICYVLVSFVLAAGILYVFLSGERPRLGTVVGRGVAYFWRFVRLTLFLAVIAGPVLGILFGLRTAYLSSADEKYVEAAYDVRALLTLLVIAVVAVFLRLWFDIAEALVVRNGIAGDRAVRRTIGPSIRLLWRNLIRACGSYVLAGALGWIGLLLLLWIWMSLSPHAVMLGALMGQVGIFLLLAGRVWQRGIVAALVLAEPVFVPVTAVIEPFAEVPVVEVPVVAVPVGDVPVAEVPVVEVPVVETPGGEVPVVEAPPAEPAPPRVVDVPPHGEDPEKISPAE